MRNTASLLSKVIPVAMGQMMQADARTTPMLVMFAPITLPKDMEGSPSKLEMMANEASGAEVPMATTVRPMTKVLTPSDAARAEAPFTSRLAPTTRRASPPRRYRMSTSMRQGPKAFRTIYNK